VEPKEPVWLLENGVGGSWWRTSQGAEFLAFAPECGHGAGMGGFAFVEGERGDDDRACEGLDNA
jgi:hypothetical protein